MKKVQVLSYVGLAAAAVGLAVATPLLSRHAPRCTSEIVRVNANVAESKRAFESAVAGDPQAACVARRAYVAALKEAAPVAARCGPTQMTSAGAWPVPDAELAFNERLLRERCP